MKFNIKNRSTKRFYNLLTNNKIKFSFFDHHTRYNVQKLLKKENIRIYFDRVIKKHINKKDVILDYGCGPGTFSIKLSYLTNNKVYGVDITKNFIKLCRKNIEFYKIKNIHPILLKDNKLPFKKNFFDKIVIIDVLHHLEDIEANFKEIYRVLKKNGKLIIYEPNKYNPAIAFTHLIEKNERGIFRLGSKNKYKKLLKDFKLKKLAIKYSGIVIGPNSIFFEKISNFLNYKIIYTFLGWLNPKILIIAKKN